MKNQKNKILIIEDERAIRKALREKFTREDFEVIEAVDGRDGLAKALSEKPNLILLDIIMPKMDGITMLRRLKEYSQMDKVPVVILTNLSDSEKVLEAARQGAFGYLIKSNWTIDEVVERVRQKLK